MRGKRGSLLGTLAYGPVQLMSPEVMTRGHGVDDGFRTRDLRIHNPAL